MSRSLESTRTESSDADVRPTVIFMHIPKTGGLTLGDIMLREYGRGRFEIVAGLGGPGRLEAHLRFLETGEAPPPGLPGTGALRQFERVPLARRAKLRGVMGHFPFGLHEAIERPSTYLTLVRDPIDRVLSAYQHRVVRQRFALSLEDYIRSERDPAMHNHQVRLLSGGRPDRRNRPGRGSLEKAMRNVEDHFALVGLTERFDESVVLAAHLFGWRKTAYRRQNEGRGRPRREDLAPELLMILERTNELDRELLEWARARFQQQLDVSGIDVERALARLHRKNAVFRWVAPRQARTGPNWKQHPVERVHPPAPR